MAEFASSPELAQIRTTPFPQVEPDALTAMTPTERAESDAAEAEEEARLRLAKLVHAARTDAGLTRTEPTRRTGTEHSVIAVAS